MTRRQAIRRHRPMEEPDWYITVGGARRPPIWPHVAYAVLLVAFLVAAVLLAGGRFA